MPVFLNSSGTEYVLLPFHDLRVSGKLSPSHSCIGHATGLPAGGACLSDNNLSFATGGSIHGLISLEDADSIAVSSLGSTLCVLFANNVGAPGPNGDKPGASGMQYRASGRSASLRGVKLQELKGEKLGVCVSGGLDSKTVARRLLEEGLDVLGFTADVAQPDEKDIHDVARRMATTGVETVVVDLKDDMAEACFMMLKAQAMYDGGYWNTTGIARAVTVHGLLGPMRERGCTVLVHGATGRGNDQIRFERYTNTLAPRMKVYAPWRDDTLLKQFPGRQQMAAYLQEQGIEAKLEKKRYSTDANLAGMSHEAEDLEDLRTSELIVDPEMGVWPHQAPDTMEEVTVRFVRSRCVEINGEAVTPLEAMLTANRIAGRNGVGMRNALENRVIGTKSRGVYEAPGLELLGYCLRAVYQTSMDRRSTGMFHAMSRLIAEQVYDARLFDPGARAALAGIDVLADYATATVHVALYRGNILFKALTDCPNSLYNPADASMEASDGLDPRSAQGFVEVQACEALNIARAGQIANPFWGPHAAKLR